MTPVLLLAGFVAGVLNSVAGGGSFISLPALIVSGVPPVAANATSTFGMVPGSAASAFAYRHDFGGFTQRVLALTAASILGGLLGGLLLVRTSDTSFMRLLPWLMLAAATTFTFGGRLTSRLGTSNPHGVITWAVPLQFLISIYGGYFGGGMGIMMLAVFAASGMTDIHEMNGLKAVLGVAINAVALVEFIVNRAVVWGPGIVVAVGGIIGGYVGARVARRLNRDHVRTFIIVVAWGMTVYFFLRPST